MILEIFIVLLCISFVFIILGYSQGNDAQIFKVTGFTIIFLLGVMIIPNTFGTLEYVTGVEITETSQGYETTDITTTYENFTIGFMLAIAAFFGFVQTYFTHKGGFNDND